MKRRHLYDAYANCEFSSGAYPVGGMMPMPQRDYNDIAAIIQAAVNPLMSEVQSLKGKVDVLSVDRITRTDLEKLRTEIVGSYVPRDSYEARHSALIDRNLQLETAMRELRKDYEADVQRLNERLESGKQQLEVRIKDAQETELSAKDRNWLRFSQALGILSVVIVAIDWLSQHVKF